MIVVPLTIRSMGRHLRTPLKQLLLLTAVLLISACSRYKAQTSAQIIVSGLTSNLSNDLILNGLSEDGEFFSTHLKANQTPSPIEIPVGKWKFYGFYWENRTAYCTWNSSELLGATERVDLTFSKENCFHEKFAHPLYRKNNTNTARLPLYLIPCSKYTVDKKDAVINSLETLELNCNLLGQVEYQSVKVTLPSVNLSTPTSPEFNYDSVVSECIDVSAPEGNQKVFSPIGANIPFFQDIEFFSDTTCTNKFGSVKINRLLGDTNKGRYIIAEDPENGLTNVISLFLDEFDETAILEEEEEEEVEVFAISLENGGSGTFERAPKFTVTGVNEEDNVYLFTSEHDCQNFINFVGNETSDSTRVDVSVSDNFGLGEHEIFSRTENSKGEKSECITTTYYISDNPTTICENAVFDPQYETSLDCGGACAREEGSFQCNFGDACTNDDDCGTGFCDHNTYTCNNYALSFNGTSNYVYFSDSNVPTLTNTYTKEPSISTATMKNFTISMWVYTNDMTTKQNLFNQRDASDMYGGGQLKVVLNETHTTDLSFWHWHYVDAPTIRETSFNVNDDPGFSANEWHHILYTAKDLDTSPYFKLFVDGEIMDEGARDVDFIRLSDDLKVYLGADVRNYQLVDSTAGKPFNGRMDDVAIWTTSFSDLEVASIYRNGHPFDLRLPNDDYLDMHVEKLHAYYRFNTSRGQSVTDSSENEFHGTVHNGNDTNWVAGVDVSPGEQGGGQEGGGQEGGGEGIQGLAIGEACSENLDCSSLLCLNVEGSDVCHQSSFYGYCQSDSDCGDGHCNLGENTCLGALAGDACSEDKECFSLSCNSESGTCDSSSHYSSCDPNTENQCASFSCLSLYGGAIPVAAHLDIIFSFNPHICRGLYLFETCEDATDCESGICLNKQCYGLTTGDTCTSNAQCFSGTCSGGTCAASTGNCASDHDCTEGKCIENQCKNNASLSFFTCEDNDSPTWPYETDFNCGSLCSYYGAKHQCQAGQSCNEDEDCGSGYCESGNCVDKSLEFKNGKGTYVYFDVNEMGPVDPSKGKSESNSPAIDDSDGLGEWTINLWFKSNNTDDQVLIAQKEANDDGKKNAFVLELLNTDIVYNYTYTGENLKMISYSTGGPSLCDDQWHMVTISKKKVDGVAESKMYIYLDGVLKVNGSKITEDLGALSNLNKIYFGKNVSDSMNPAPFVGLMDDITFWNKKLVDTEVEQLYNDGKAVNPLINFHHYKSANYVTNHYNMNYEDSDHPEIIYDSGPYQENGYAHYSGADSAENKSTFFDYNYEDTPGGRMATISLKGLCEENFDDVLNDLGIKNRTFDELSVHYVSDSLDVPSLSPAVSLTNEGGLDVHFSDKSQYYGTLILADNRAIDNFHYYPIQVTNDYYFPDKNIIRVDSNTTDDNDNSVCNLRNAIKTWNSPATSFGNCDSITSNEPLTSTVIMFDTDDPGVEYSVTGASGDDNNMSGDFDVLCTSGNCGDLYILGCGNANEDLTNYTILDATASTNRIFDIHDNVNIIIENLALKAGTASDGLGGAIKNTGNLAIKNLNFHSNLAQGPNGESYNSGVTEFYGGGGGGASGMGGAIYNDGTLVLEAGLIFSDNQATGGNGGDGGILVCQSTAPCNDAMLGEIGLGGAGGGLESNNGEILYEETEMTDEHGNPVFIETITAPSKNESFKINSGGHGGLTFDGQGSLGTTGGLGGGTGGAGLNDVIQSGTTQLFRAGGGGATDWVDIGGGDYEGRAGGGGAGGAFGAAIFNNHNGVVLLFEGSEPTFSNNTLVEGTEGNSEQVHGGSEANMNGIGTFANPENLFNYNGNVRIEKLNGVEEEFNFNPSGTGNDLKFYDYQCGVDLPDNCQCTNGVCSVP